MKQTTRTLIALIAFNSALQSCSTDTIDSGKVDNEEIYQSYDLVQEEGSNQVKGYVQFRVGGGTGTTVSLSEPSKIKLNNRELSKVSFLGTSYEVSVDKNPDDTYTFEWVDQKEKSYRNKVGTSTIKIVSSPEELKKGAHNYIQVEISQNAKGETINVELSQEGQGGESVLRSHGATLLGDKVEIRSEWLQEFITGRPVTVRIIVSQFPGLQETNSKGGSLSVRAKARALRFNLVP
jgi:hypothetical protein